MYHGGKKLPFEKYFPANLGDIEICSNNESHVSRDHQLRKTLFFDMNVLHIKLETILPLIDLFVYLLNLYFSFI